MPDITMCATRNCILWDKCWRAQADPDRWQSFAQYEGGKDCLDFLPLPNSIVRRRKAQEK